MSFYEFKEEDALRFARGHGITKRRGDELVFQRCPYCNGGTRPDKYDKYTFAINLKTGLFSCQRGSCGAKGNIVTLARDFDDFQLPDEVARYYDLNNYSGRFRRFKDSHRVTESKDEAVRYLESRGISEEVCRKYEITVKDEDSEVLVFPFKDEQGSLEFIKYRHTKPNPKASKEWCEPNCKPILFGMNHCEDFEQLVITEGQIDSLSLAEAGIKNAVSVPNGKNGFTWIPHCWDWIKKFKQIVIFGDCENGSISLVEQMSVRFGKIIKVVQIEDYCGLKDANDILRKFGKVALIKAVNNAQYAPNGHIKEMADVESLDIESLPTINTGIAQLNKLLSGGFHYGDFIVLTGKRGDGKSTMASQFTVDALNDGNNCLIYSGEMRDVAVKNWIDRQISGHGTLYPSEIAKCEDWYRGRLFIYDDSTIDENDTEDLITTITDAILQRNIRFILIDNLMTAMESAASTNEALYRQQSAFAGKLAKIARKLEVVIILVCHPRKSTNASIENDDISGSADITNKANIVLSYSRVFEHGSEIDPALRDLSITKNRLTGKLGSVRMSYTDTSKRIVGYEERDLFKNYIESNHKAEVKEENIPFA